MLYIYVSGGSQYIRLQAGIDAAALTRTLLFDRSHVANECVL